jgi:hypothetical protein
VKAHWMIGMVITAGLPVHAEDCRVDVYVTTGVSLANIMLTYPWLKVTEMFRDIGVNIQVHIGSPARHVSSACGAPIRVELDHSTDYSGTTNALAYAIPYKESGADIHIFLDRVMRGNRNPAFATVLLAHVTVHEITHVLEQSTQHSEDGVMKAQWTRADYQRMRWQSLPFAPADVMCIREGLANRVAHAAASKSAPGDTLLSMDGGLKSGTE